MRGIYSIVHRATGRCYVGSSVNIARRRKEHLQRLRRGSHPNIHLARAFATYGEGAFILRVLELCDGDLHDRENRWIASLNPVFNHAPVAGSVLGLKRSVEVRARMAAAQRERYAAQGSPLKGRARPEEVCAAISAGHIGKKRSPQHQANLTAALQGRVSARKGVTLSQETKDKVSAAKRGVPQTAEHKLSIQIGKLKKKLAGYSRPT